MPYRRDTRNWGQRMGDTVHVWAYILGLSTMMVVWALMAWAAIGNATLHHPDFNLPDPTPGAQAYNTIGTYQRPER